MKNRILSLVVLAILSLASCSNDDDSVTPNTNNTTDQAKTFRLTLRNAVNYLSVKK